jgi:hypothetical protein
MNAPWGLGLPAIRTPNHYLVLLNTNEGAVGADLLNRSLPIRLEPTGDLLQRIARAKEILGGDIKHEWRPAHREQIEAETWGMIERWREEGMPLDKTVHHPTGPCAQVIGGILRPRPTSWICNRRPGAGPFEEKRTMFRCPNCGEKDRLLIIALVTVRLIQSDDDEFGTETVDCDHEFDDNSPMSCQACGHQGRVMEFDEDRRE